MQETYYQYSNQSILLSDSLVLDAVILQPEIIAAIDTEKEPICQVRGPKVINFLDDTLIIRGDKSPPNLLEEMLVTIPLAAVCIKDNIVE